MDDNSKRRIAIARDDVLKDAAKLLDAPARRLFGKRLLTLGGLALLSGCDISSDTSGNQIDTFLAGVSRWNDRVQGALFHPDKLADVYTEAQITRPFPFNAFYDRDQAPNIDGNEFKLHVSGLVMDKRTWNLEALYGLPYVEQITRHVCVEGWSAIGRWGGTPLSVLLDRVGADRTAKYVGFKCADNYFESIDMASALHPQTQLSFTYDGKTLPRAYGYPMKLRIPTKLGYKNPKHIVEIFVTNQFPGGYWVDQGYNWFGGS